MRASRTRGGPLQAAQGRGDQRPERHDFAGGCRGLRRKHHTRRAPPPPGSLAASTTSGHGTTIARTRASRRTAAVTARLTGQYAVSPGSTCTSPVLATASAENTRRPGGAPAPRPGQPQSPEWPQPPGASTSARSTVRRGPGHPGRPCGARR
ncbi:hypothetical protein QJS66_11355 [Kocuria rhizophila]|nr:hypothetical protein QJS66_11355 [Kocuria rhizophila]